MFRMQFINALFFVFFCNNPLCIAKCKLKSDKNIVWSCDKYGKPWISMLIARSGQYKEVHKYYESGGMQYDVKYYQGMKHGLYRSWFENGMLKEKGNYFHDKLTGEFIKYYPNGNMRFRCKYLNGHLQGLVQQWHPNGILAFSCIIRYGKVNGDIIEWYDNGNKKAIKRFSNSGKAQGTWIFFDRKKNITFMSAYVDSIKTFRIRYFKMNVMIVDVHYTSTGKLAYRQVHHYCSRYKF